MSSPSSPSRASVNSAVVSGKPLLVGSPKGGEREPERPAADLLVEDVAEDGRCGYFDAFIRCIEVSVLYGMSDPRARPSIARLWTVFRNRVAFFGERSYSLLLSPSHSSRPV